jgi:twitching motility protein PilT
VLRANSRTREYVQEGEREGKSLLDAMSDGRLEGMQTFDGELERLINSDVIDREVGLSYSTNRTNLQLRLDTMGEPTAALPSLKAMQAQAGTRKPAAPRSEMDELLER